MGQGARTIRDLCGRVRNEEMTGLEDDWVSRKTVKPNFWIFSLPNWDSDGIEMENSGKKKKWKTLHFILRTERSV